MDLTPVIKRAGVRRSKALGNTLDFAIVLFRCIRSQWQISGASGASQKAIAANRGRQERRLPCALTIGGASALAERRSRLAKKYRNRQ